MPDLEHSMEPDPLDPDNLQKEVSAVEDGPENVDEEPDEDVEDYEGEDEPEEQDAPDNEPPEDPAQEDPRVAQLESQMSQMYQLMTQMSQQRQQAPPPAPVAPTSSVPQYTADQLEEMSNAELFKTSLAQSSEQVQEQVSQVREVAAQGLAYQGQQIVQILDVLMTSNPEWSHIKGALQMMNTSPGLQFPIAYQAAKAQSLTTNNSQLQQQVQQSRRSRRKHGRKAQQQQVRPRHSRKIETPQYKTTGDAVKAAMQEAGLPALT